jgi:tRNA pseudouridine55 synthase
LSGTASFVLPVDKPAGPTSHDVVAQVRRALKTRRVGHTGTLDPFASGLLLICVGHATRVAEYLTDLPKTYRARARLDGRTLTDDDTSEILDASEAWRGVSEAQVRAGLGAQVGEIMQMPPQYSAKKIAGERAYEIARRGDVATLTPARVRIYRIDVHEVDLPNVTFEVECSSGTYIRAIARDLGVALGTGGYLTELRRTRIGGHDVAQAVHLDELGEEARIRDAALTPAQAIEHMNAVELTDDEVRAIRFGQRIESHAHGDDLVRLMQGGNLIAIAQPVDGMLKPRKVLADV